MHGIDEVEEECDSFPMVEPHARMPASLPSTGSLPYDERQAYYSGKPPKFSTLNNRSRRRSKPVPSSSSATRWSGSAPPQHIRSQPRSPYSNGSDSPPPSLMAIGSAMINILSLYLKHHGLALRRSCRRRRKFLLLSLGALLLFLMLWLSFLSISFYMDAVRMCTPPADYNPFEHPLVEYYIHGHGNGHYARSMAIIETLNDAGVDVRMFIGRATIWNFYHQAKPLLGGKKGVTTAIAVTSIQPSLGVFACLSHVLERIMGDCEVALQTSRYPFLVISDGDAPGMLRAFFGSIPSVGISHGQIFSIAQKPDWVLEDPRLNKAWDSQGRLNRRAALFSSWQIGTDFGYLETQQASAVVARPPLRPEVLHMAAARKQHVHHDSADPEIAQRMANLVLHGTEYVDNNNTTTAIQRKIVLAYFRDHNGQMIIDSLLQAGFDILFFETGYNKNLDKDPNRYGTKWIVREEDRVKLREAAQFEAGAQKPRKKRLPLVDRRRLEEEEAEVSREAVVETAGDLQRRLSTDTGSPRVIRVVDRALFVPFMSIADGIVASAGSQMISECIYANLPLLALYRTDDDEQVLNVELSRQERVMRRKIPVYGTSFENFQSAFPTKYSYVRRTSNRTTTSTPKLHSSGAKVACSEFESFVDKVDESAVSEAYFRYLKDPKNNVTRASVDSESLLSLTELEDDPFHGMPDAAAVILEIVKQVRKEFDEA